MGAKARLQKEHLELLIGRVLGLILPLSCALITLAYAPFLSDYMVAKKAFLHAILGLVAGIWLLRGVLVGHLLFPAVAWLGPACGYWLIALFSLSQASNWQQGVELLFVQGGLFIVAITIADYYRGRMPWVLLATVAATASLVSFIGVLQYADINLIPIPHDHSGILGISTLGNPNFVAHYLEIAILLTLGFLLVSRGLWLRGLLVANLILLGYYMLLTQSRGGWLALGCGVAFFCCRIGKAIVQRVPWPAFIIALVLMGGGAEYGLRTTTGHDGSEDPYGGLVGFVERVGQRVVSAADMQHISVAQRKKRKVYYPKQSRYLFVLSKPYSRSK